MKSINNKGISTLAIVLIIVVVLLAGGVVWWKASKNNDMNTSQNSNSSNNANTGTNTNSNQNINITTDPVTGWNIYTNSKYGYRLKFPKEWRLVLTDDNEVVESDTFGIQTAYIQNFLDDSNIYYHPQKGEISIDVYVYKTTKFNLDEWFNEYIKTHSREKYASVSTERIKINDKHTIVEKILTGESPKILLDTEWLDGKIANYYIKNNQQVLEISAVVLTEDENLLSTADQIAKSLTFVK